MPLPSQKFLFIYQNHHISCEVYPPHPLTKKHKISISLTADNILKIKAPKQTLQKELLKILEKHGEWIIQQKQKKHSQKLQFIQSEKHPFLGQYYALNITENNQQKQNIQLINQQLQITTHHNVPHKISCLLDSWYKFQALDIFSQRILLMKPVISWIDWENHSPILRIKKMTSRWGSYINRNHGIITLNQQLIKAPLECIDYVILHELCHAAEPNHSKRFYKLVASIMPTWKIYQSQLQQQGSLFLYNLLPKAED